MSANPRVDATRDMAIAMLSTPMIQFDVEPGAAQIVLGHGAQH
jgi:hypothetical protein